MQFRYNRTTGVIIVVGFILAAVIAGIGVVTALTISSSGHTFPSKQCGETPRRFLMMKVYQNILLLVLGYKVIPVNSTTTEVTVTSCT
ncbi:MAG: hypothetical protein M3P08_08065 [Thermoproteota archaeon]|nr:hypothetical protein [Thermoproteota archaeon]